MTKTAIDARDRVIKAAAKMLAQHGLKGISIREVVKFAKAPLGSTYHHFPGGKQQIVAEAVRWAGERSSMQLKACLEKDAQKGVRNFLNQWREQLLTSDYKQGCPIVAAAIEHDDEQGDMNNNPVKEAVSSVFQDWQQLLSDHLQKLGTRLNILILKF